MHTLDYINVKSHNYNVHIIIIIVGQSCIIGDVRLFGGKRPTEGTVEVCVDGEWQTICGYNWDTNDATVVCRQLGYSTTGLTNS